MSGTNGNGTALRDRLLKAGIEPADLAQIVIGEVQKRIVAAQRIEAKNLLAEQRLWDQIFAAALGGLASWWQWDQTPTIEVARRAADLASAAMEVRKRRGAQ